MCIYYKLMYAEYGAILFLVQFKKQLQQFSWIFFLPPILPDHWPDAHSVRWSEPECARAAFQSLEVLRQPLSRHWRMNAVNHVSSHHQV